MVFSAFPRRPVWTEAEEQAEANRRSNSLAGVAVTLLLMVIGLFLIHTLHHAASLQDCLMSGHSDCAALVNIPTD